MSILLIVIDTETGGLDWDAQCIIEVAAQALTIDKYLNINLNGISPFAQRIAPDRPVSLEAAAVNGYDPDKWGGGSAHSVLRDLAYYAQETLPADSSALWCGADPGFDRNFIRSDRRRHGFSAAMPISYRNVDVESLALPLYAAGEIEKTSLQALRDWAGIPGAEIHTALQDVRDTISVLHYMLDSYGPAFASWLQR